MFFVSNVTFEGLVGTNSLDGVLAVNDGNCVAVRGHGKDTLFLWPRGTVRSTKDPSAFEVPGFGEVKVGDRIRASDNGTYSARIDPNMDPTVGDYARAVPRIKSCGKPDDPVVQIAFRVAATASPGE